MRNLLRPQGIEVVVMDSPQGLTCRGLVDFLDDYLSGELPPAERVRFEQHLVRCRECFAYLVSYRASVRLTRALCDELDDTVPADVPSELVTAIVAARLRS